MPNYGHLSLSCTKIERPSPLEKPSCKVRLFAQNRSRIYRQKVTATTLFQTVSHRVFQLLPQTAHVCFRGRKWVHTRLCQQDRTQGHTRRNTGPSLPRLQRGFALPVKSLCYTTRFHRAFIYIHFPVLCEPPLSAERKIRRNCRHKFYPPAVPHCAFQLLLQTAHVRFHG